METTQAAKIQELKAGLSKLSERDRVFASSLVSQGEVHDLSQKQMYWVDKMIAKTQEVPMVSAQIENVKGIIELISRPGSRLKSPKIRFLVSLFGFDTQAEFTLSIAGERSRYPGTINVTSGRYPDSVFYGRIHQNGDYEVSRRIDAKDQANVIAELKKLAQDPEGMAKEYGKKMGRCCFCSLHLDDERSVAEGYGPVCAKNYKLQWGGRPGATLPPVAETELQKTS